MLIPDIHLFFSGWSHQEDPLRPELRHSGIAMSKAIKVGVEATGGVSGNFTGRMSVFTIFYPCSIATLLKDLLRFTMIYPDWNLICLKMGHPQFQGILIIFLIKPQPFWGSKSLFGSENWLNKMQGSWSWTNLFFLAALTTKSSFRILVIPRAQTVFAESYMILIDICVNIPTLVLHCKWLEVWIDKIRSWSNRSGGCATNGSVVFPGSATISLGFSQSWLRVRAWCM